AQRPGGTPLQGQPPPQQQQQPPPQAYPQPPYPLPTPPVNSAPYALPQPSSSGSLDLSNIKPSNSGSVSLADAVARARGFAAEKGVAYGSTIAVPAPVHVLHPGSPETASETITTLTVMNAAVTRDEMGVLTIAKDRSPRVAIIRQQRHEVSAGVLHLHEVEMSSMRPSRSSQTWWGSSLAGKGRT
ncbi:MAG: hypothetical protein Q9198_010900, partial [Flavoplaca austrocitrina]